MPTTVWVDYGQPAASAERQASAAVASHYAAPWREVRVEGLHPPNAGEFPGRNDLLVASARATAAAASIAVGVHAGTGYADCSPTWADAWSALIDAQDAGRASLVAPLLELSKKQVFDLARSLAVPIELTHSCEAGPLACGQCASCLDRLVDDARA